VLRVTGRGKVASLVIIRHSVVREMFRIELICFRTTSLCPEAGYSGWVDLLVALLAGKS
jgi:hypothetical protein